VTGEFSDTGKVAAALRSARAKMERRKLQTGWEKEPYTREEAEADDGLCSSEGAEAGWRAVGAQRGEQGCLGGW
jgi:hypothetical protein